MQSLFVCGELESASLVYLPGEFSSYAYEEDTLWLKVSTNKREIRLEERKTADALYIGETTTEGVSIYGEVQSVLGPVLSDFYLPMDIASCSFYKKIENYLNTDQAPESISRYFHGYVKSHSIPFYPVPLTTLSGVFKYYNFKEFKSSRNKIRLVKKIKIEEKIPGPDPATEEAVRGKIGQEYDVFKKAFEKAFIDREVRPIKGLEEYFKSKPEVFHMWKWSSVKNILPCIAYTYSTGPWKKLWIRFGYNPTEHPEAYKYQVYMWKNISKAFAIVDHPEIYEKVKDTDGFRTKRFNSRTGFLTTKALDYIHKKFSEIDVTKPERAPESIKMFDDLDFQILDE